MKPLAKAAVVALLQILIVSSLGAKLLYDRRTCPQAWFFTQRYDPNLPIRGRYVSLQITVNGPHSNEEISKQALSQLQTGVLNGFQQWCGSIVLRNGTPTAEFDSSPMWHCDNLTFVLWPGNGAAQLRLSQPILFFIPDTAKDPTVLSRGDELWVLATIPRKGPPRPIELGVKRAGETEIRGLDLN
ncbi:MAG TPA: hypothetical protein VIX37_05435 [Candidatus Sulfotelmatobacter sp.]